MILRKLADFVPNMTLFNTTSVENYISHVNTEDKGITCTYIATPDRAAAKKKKKYYVTHYKLPSGDVALSKVYQERRRQGGEVFEKTIINLIFSENGDVTFQMQMKGRIDYLRFVKEKGYWRGRFNGKHLRMYSFKFLWKKWDENVRTAWEAQFAEQVVRHKLGPIHFQKACKRFKGIKYGLQFLPFPAFEGKGSYVALLNADLVPKKLRKVLKQPRLRDICKHFTGESGPKAQALLDCVLKGYNNSLKYLPYLARKKVSPALLLGAHLPRSWNWARLIAKDANAYAKICKSTDGRFDWFDALLMLERIPTKEAKALFPYLLDTSVPSNEKHDRLVGIVNKTDFEREKTEMLPHFEYLDSLDFGKDLKVLIPQNVYELCKIGRDFKNCVAGYAGAVKSKRTGVFALYDSSGSRVACVEVSEYGETVQASGVGNAGLDENLSERIGSATRDAWVACDKCQDGQNQHGIVHHQWDGPTWHF